MSIMSEAEQAEQDAEYATMVNNQREGVHVTLTTMRNTAALLERQLTRLGDGPGNLYDVEYAEGDGPLVAAAALGQIRVGVAAITSVVEEPGA